MKDNGFLIPLGFFLFCIILLCYGIHTDHIYKMKKLELVERGIIKDFKD
jgi:hypothetical protein